MIGFAADGARVPAPAMHMRRIHLGKEDILVDMRKNMQTSQLLAPFGVQATGDFAFQSSSNFVEICRVLRNLLLNHRVIFGTPVKSINDENFCVYVPSYKSISAELTWEVLNCDIEKSAQKLYDIRMKAFRELLTPEEFFRLFPSTGCPYFHALNDETDEVDSTCTLCEGYTEGYTEDILKNPGRRSRSRSPKNLVHLKVRCCQNVMKR
tara:strand:- start:1346 stop:1972 length:627 start_codon:yes stop_codon:yes gene_type:complete